MPAPEQLDKHITACADQQAHRERTQHERLPYAFKQMPESLYLVCNRAGSFPVKMHDFPDVGVVRAGHDPQADFQRSVGKGGDCERVDQPDQA